MEKQEKATEYKEYDVHESVPEADRHYTFKDMAATWTVANANPTSWYVGCTLGALGFGAAIAAALAGNIATYVILALVGLMGYKIGTSNMGLARVPFGIVGSKGPSVICLIILSIWITVRIFQSFSFESIRQWTPPADIRMPFGQAIDALAALGFAWVMAVADYTRYTKTGRAATAAPMLGATFGMIWFCLTGSISAIAVAIQNNLFDPYVSDPGSVCTMLGMGQVANIMIVLSTISVNLINVYSGGFSTANFTTRLAPKTSMSLIAVLATLLALIPLWFGSFLDTFQAFLGYLGAVFPPCIAIMIADYYFIRKQRYHTDALNEKGGRYWYRNGVNWKAIAVWLLGAACYFICLQLSFIVQTVGAVFVCFFVTLVLYAVAGRVGSKPA